MTFDTFVMVDWSGGNAKGQTPSADAIWACVARDGKVANPVYFPSRQAIEPWLSDMIRAERGAGRRLMIGFDFAFGLPAPAAEIITGSPDPLALWGWLADRIEDAPKSNNRFDVAARINQKFEGVGPYWGNGLKRDIPHLPRKGRARRGHTMPERRVVETKASGAFSVWQLSGVGAVGSQTLMGLPLLERLRRTFAGQIAVWPFETMERPVCLVEIWPSLKPGRIKTRAYEGWIKDAAQVHAMASWAAGMTTGELTTALAAPKTKEGWIFGVGP